MGITGLLPFLKTIQRQVNISLFRGKKVAVDAYCWLHRGAYSCPMELVMGPKEGEKIETLPFLKYCIRRVKMLLDKGVTPIIVFDGSQLPIKSKVEAERRKRRKEYKEKGKALLREGKRSEAHDCFQKCIDVSPEMAHAFIKACHEMKVECIVAPYEADSQLAYLSMQGIVDLVITEDSDLLVFGCKKVLFKMDEIGGGLMVDSDDFGTMKDGKLTNFTLDEFRQMCILSGCDYLASVPGIGLTTAHKLMKKYARNVNNVIKVLKFDKGKAVPKDYQEQFKQAELTFKHQLVFDPRTQKQVPLTPLPEGTDQSDYEFAGSMVSPCKAVGLARGNINPLTHEVMDTFSPSKVSSSPVDNSKQKKWSSSGIATSYRHYSTPIQANLDMFSSSEKSRQKFKPPRKTDNNNDLSNDNATLLSYYSCSNDHEDSLEENANSDKKQTTPSSASDSTSRSNTITISRFFTGQNGCTNCTPLNPFSRSKANTAAAAAASVARKLDLSSIHDSSAESSRGGGKSVIDPSNHLPGDVDIIEQSPVKDTSSGHIENVEDTSVLDEVNIIDSPSSTVTVEDVHDEEKDSKRNSCSQLEQGNTNMLAKDEDSTIEEDNCNKKRITSPVAKRLGHCDLREFAFRRKSEREKQPPQNSRSLSLPSNGITLSAPTLPRKTMSLEDFLCPLERKRHKAVTTESKAKEFTVQASYGQDANLKDYDEPVTKNALSSVRVSNRKTPTLNKSSSLSTKRTKGTKATDRSLSTGQLNLKKFAYTTKQENVLELHRHTLVENNK